MTSVAIPTSVASIGSHAFEGQPTTSSRGSKDGLQPAQRRSASASSSTRCQDVGGRSAVALSHGAARNATRSFETFAALRKRKKHAPLPTSQQISTFIFNVKNGSLHRGCDYGSVSVTCPVACVLQNHAVFCACRCLLSTWGCICVGLLPHRCTSMECTSAWKQDRCRQNSTISRRPSECSDVINIVRTSA